MNQPNDQTDPRLERLLRRWGAQKAAQAAAGERPACRPPAPPARRLLLWSVTAAAASLLFCVGGAVFFLRGLAERRETTGAHVALPVPTLQATVPSVPLADKQAVERELAATRTRLQGEIDRLNTAHAAALAELEKTISARTALLRSAEMQLTTQADEMWLAKVRVGELDRRIATLTAEQQGTMVQLVERTNEIGRLTGQLNDQRLVLLRQFQAVYLGGQGSLAARQQAIRTFRLADRLAAVRKDAHGEQAGRVIDQLDVWLTRIVLADAANPAVARPLARQAGSAGLAPLIEQLLVGGDQPAAVSNWLLECELVLLNIEAGG